MPDKNARAHKKSQLLKSNFLDSLQSHYEGGKSGRFVCPVSWLFINELTVRSFQILQCHSDAESFEILIKSKNDLMKFSHFWCLFSCQDPKGSDKPPYLISDLSIAFPWFFENLLLLHKKGYFGKLTKIRDKQTKNLKILLEIAPLYNPETCNFEHLTPKSREKRNMSSCDCHVPITITNGRLTCQYTVFEKSPKNVAF